MLYLGGASLYSWWWLQLGAFSWHQAVWASWGRIVGQQLANHFGIVGIVWGIVWGIIWGIIWGIGACSPGEEKTGVAAGSFCAGWGPQAAVLLIRMAMRSRSMVGLHPSSIRSMLEFENQKLRWVNRLFASG